ncbi:hypothetical protein F4778DRAFT_789298 [Xylariomycetidae sp. FL2044]|nr:hypothetical protein F4778DRAFT_789298 [Xylariomycetidae sp. FL2044]
MVRVAGYVPELHSRYTLLPLIFGYEDEVLQPANEVSNRGNGSVVTEQAVNAMDIDQSGNNMDIDQSATAMNLANAMNTKHAANATDTEHAVKNLDTKQVGDDSVENGRETAAQGEALSTVSTVRSQQSDNKGERFSSERRQRSQDQDESFSFECCQRSGDDHALYPFAQRQKQIALRISELEHELKRLRHLQEVNSAEMEVVQASLRVKREGAGVSRELWKQYKAFCRGLDGEEGPAQGFAITCPEDHGGSYIKYDPSFNLFKQHSDGHYLTRNYRCEASTVMVKEEVRGSNGQVYIVQKPQYIVEFWEIKPVWERAPVGTRATWSECWPTLYQLAKSAALGGSDGAKGMLMALPEAQSFTKGGTLFEYEREESKKDHLLKSQRWSFRAAYKIFYSLVPKPAKEAKRLKVNEWLTTP